MNATPQQITAVAIIMGNASKQLSALAQAIIRPDLDANDQLPTARNACTLARDSLEQLLELLPRHTERRRDGVLR